MTEKLDLDALFEKHEDEYLKFERIEAPLSACPDLAAFMLLDKLAPEFSQGKPGERMGMISAAGYGEIYLQTDIETLAEKATEADIITLIRCGVRLDVGNVCLAMFV